MAGIQVAADALQAQFLLVVFIIKMGRHPVVGQSLGEKVHVATLARLVEDDGLCVFQLALACKVDILLLLGHCAPDVVHAHSGFGRKVLPCTFGRQVALGAASLHAAAVVVVNGLFPAVGCFWMEMASHASLVG